MRNPHSQPLIVPKNYNAWLLLAEQFVKACDVCQKFNNVIHAPTNVLHPISIHWPFYKWGTDVVGPLPPTTGHRKFMLVAINYFTKWAETERYTQIKVNHLIQLIQRSIVCLFGTPHIIVSNNGPQFVNKPFKYFCSEHEIKNVYSTPRHPQSNDQSKVTNKTMIKYLKKG